MNTDKHELEKGASLYGKIRAVLERARSSDYRAVNLAISLKRCWKPLLKKHRFEELAMK